MLTADQALAAIVSQATVLAGIERCALGESLGRVLAEDICSGVDVPPCDNSAMDGYAFRSADLDSCNQLPLSIRIPAGGAPSQLPEGTVARIFTGAPIPTGADCVEMQENCEAQGDGVKFQQPVRLGQHIRPRGQDIALGDVVATEGTCLQPQHLGLMAAVGLAQLPVRRRLQVAVVSTGDELVEPGEALLPGQIYNSNRYLLSALLRQLGAEVVDGGILEDDRQATELRLAELAGKADLVISSGGVSVGEEDYVKAAVEAQGELNLWKVAIKPGKPLAFGKIVETPFFGLPGNPVSTFVTFLLFVRPYIQRCQGRQPEPLDALQAAVDFERSKPGGRQEYVRVKLLYVDGKAVVSTFSNQSSGVLSSTTWANALAVIPAGVTLRRGDLVEVIPYRNLLT